MIPFDQSERAAFSRLVDLKAKSGSHSPSPAEVEAAISPQKVKIDACFLSNPYATDLFIDYFGKTVAKNDIRRYVENYPSQNHSLAERISRLVGAAPENILITNGAIEGIELLVKEWIKGRFVVNIPTFSSYYEFCSDPERVIYNRLEKSNNYKLNVDKLLDIMDSESPDAIILINPNNPDGQLVQSSEVERLCTEALKRGVNIVIDESFIQLAPGFRSFTEATHIKLRMRYPNVVIVKSLSKDFGIAGLRLGYIVANQEVVAECLKYGKLWNINGISELFIDYLADEDFTDAYETARVKHIEDTIELSRLLSEIRGVTALPTSTNFVLLDTHDVDPTIFAAALLIRYGVLARSASDKIGLEGNYIRIATRRRDENISIARAIRELVAE